ncbi:ferritin-like domain-containing protein [Sphingomonas flavalba]|uniref:ferritin-like domain-containing protein n=1 Tax=Sphingomonas flavalba TaxID=2559804 RepID=UPI001EF00342|nr:ferritin-like domain-containing protein [Sphingomonas flavalba]
MTPGERASVADAARAVLDAADPAVKVKAARAAARALHAGRLALRFDTAMPDRPARPDRPLLLSPGRMPKRGRGGSLRGRIALLHAIAHIECVAIDLAFDMAGRFGGGFPPAFVADWFRVGAEEAMHFALLQRRLRAFGSHYGAFPAHDGLWEAAAATAGDPVARLAVVPMVLEARGLDVTPTMIAQCEAAGDSTTAQVLARILRDEIGRVGIGTAWFRYACESSGLDPVTQWKMQVERHVPGAIKPPFNDSARGAAGLTRDYYTAIDLPTRPRHTVNTECGGLDPHSLE